MKLHKKIVLASVILSTTLLAAAFLSKHFVAALTSPPTVSVSNFKFLDAATITGSIDGSTITFTDGNPTDSTRNFRPQGLDSSIFCDYKGSGNQRYGINITSSSLGGANINATIGLGYILQSGNNSSCPQIPGANIQPSSSISIANPGSAATSFYRWQGANIVYVDGGQTFQAKPASGTTPYINENNIGQCEASGIILLSGTDSGTLYHLGSAGVGGGGSSLPNNISQYLSSPNSCSLVSKEVVNIAGTAPSSANTGGVVTCNPNTNPDCICSSQGCTLTSNTTQAVSTDDSSACVANSHTSLEWILCPITTSVSKFVDSMIKVIEDQLNFDVGSYLPDSGQVHTVWAIFKNLVSAMIIIVLLIMVISQAIGAGPFDAYTIRKILPKLIIAIIFMQLSWYMAKYLITIANDFGHGIRQIMLAPFNGAGNMDLNSILNHLNGTWALGVNVVGFSGMLIAVLAFSEFILPILALMAFSVAMSVLVGLATLLFRNVLIIMLVILFPAALLLWALPGAGFQRYWKLWSENFTKLLMLFPIMMAIIYAGRIVAWIGGGVGGAGFLDFCLVVVAYFGPLFYLPKAFSLGGTWLNTANRAINESWPIKKGREVGNRELKGWVNRTSGASSKYNPYQPVLEGYGKFKMPNRRFIPKGLRGQQMAALPTGGRMVQRIKSGSIMPTDRGRAIATQKYETWKSERDAEQKAYDDTTYQAGEQGLFDGNLYSLNDDGTISGDNRKGKTGVGSAKAAVIANLAAENPRLAKVAMEKLMDTQSFIEFQHNMVELDPTLPHHAKLIADLEESGRELPEVNGKRYARLYWMPAFEGNQENNPQYWSTISGKRTDLTPPVLQSKYPRYVSQAEVDQESDPDKKRALQNTRNDIRTNYGLSDAEWQTKQGKRMSEKDRMIKSIVDSYVGADNVGKQAQGFFQEIKRHHDPTLSRHFANLLGSIASGGPSAVNQLIGMQGAEGTSIADDLNEALAPVGIKFQEYIDAARQGAAPPQPRAPGVTPPPAGGTAPSPGPDTGPTGPVASGGGTSGTSPRNVQSGSEQIIFQQQPRVVQTQPGEIVSAGGVVLSPRAQEQMNRQFDELHDEFKKLRRLEGTRNEQEERRFQEIRGQNPQFESEPEEEEGNQS